MPADWFPDENRPRGDFRSTTGEELAPLSPPPAPSSEPRGHNDSGFEWRSEIEAIRAAADRVETPKWHAEAELPPLDEAGERRLDAVLEAEPEPPGWPRLDDAALQGIAGRVVRAMEPHTEADRAAILVDLLVSTGNALGTGPHFLADGADHPARLFAMIVGRTSKSRKGTSRANIARVMRHADEPWATQSVIGGLSSGEGLIKELQDASDPRRLVVETELSRVLSVASRQGSILSEVLRQAWDGGHLRVTTRTAPLFAPRHHVSIVAHITEHELRRTLTSAQAANGFGNRFLFVAAKRSKLLPDGGTLTEDDYAALGREVSVALERGRRIGRMERNPAASEVWRTMYQELSVASPGMVGALTARAEAHLLRLSVLYAALDGSPQIQPDHLRGARAVWDYCQASVEWLFGSASGNATADRLLVAIREAGPGGLDLTAQRDLFARHAEGGRLQTARDLLEDLGLIETVEEATKGRPRKRCYAVESAPWRHGDQGDQGDRVSS